MKLPQMNAPFKEDVSQLTNNVIVFLVEAFPEEWLVVTLPMDPREDEEGHESRQESIQLEQTRLPHVDARLMHPKDY